MKFRVALLAVLLLACNREPVIEQVGDFLIADSVLDYLNPDYSDQPYFSVSLGQRLTFRVVATDADGDHLVYSAGPLPMDATFHRETGEFDWQVWESDYTKANNRWELYVMVEDGQGGWDSLVVPIELYDATLPYATSLPEDFETTPLPPPQ